MNKFYRLKISTPQGVYALVDFPSGLSIDEARDRGQLFSQLSNCIAGRTVEFTENVRGKSPVIVELWV